MLSIDTLPLTCLPYGRVLHQKGNTMTATGLQYPQWQKPLLRAVLEIKPDTLIDKIKISETAISQRLAELENNVCCKEERLALQDAVSILQKLKSALNR